MLKSCSEMIHSSGVFTISIISIVLTRPKTDIYLKMDGIMSLKGSIFVLCDQRRCDGCIMIIHHGANQCYILSDEQPLMVRGGIPGRANKRVYSAVRVRYAAL